MPTANELEKRIDKIDTTIKVLFAIGGVVVAAIIAIGGFIINSNLTTAFKSMLSSQMEDMVRTEIDKTTRKQTGYSLDELTTNMAGLANAIKDNKGYIIAGPIMERVSSEAVRCIWKDNYTCWADCNESDEVLIGGRCEIIDKGPAYLQNFGGGGVDSGKSNRWYCNWQPTKPPGALPSDILGVAKAYCARKITADTIAKAGKR